MTPQIGEIWRGLDGLGLVTYINKMGDVSLRVNGQPRHVYRGEFADGYEKFELED